MKIKIIIIENMDGTYTAMVQEMPPVHFTSTDEVEAVEMAVSGAKSWCSMYPDFKINYNNKWMIEREI